MKTNLKTRISLFSFVISVSILYSTVVDGQCTVTNVNPTTINSTYQGGTYYVSVYTSGCTNYTVSNYTGFATSSQSSYTVTVTVPYNSGSARNGRIVIGGSRVVWVYQDCGGFPTAPSWATSDRNNFCANAGGNISLSVSGGSGTTLHWYTGGCGSVSIGTGNPLSIAAPTSTTTYYARWETDCSSSSCVNTTVTVLPLPTAPGLASSDQNNYCNGTVNTISLSSSGGSGTTLQWYSGSCGGTSVGSGSPKVIQAPSTTTTYYARWENSCGVSSCASIGVTVYPQPVAPGSAASDRNNICSNAGGNISLSTSGGSGTTLHWFSGSCGGTSIGTGNPLSIAAPTSTTTYYARWETSCGNSGCASVTVTVMPLPVAPASTTSDRNNICSNAGGNISLSASGGSGTTIRWFNGSCGGTSIGTGNPLVLSAPITTTTYYARWENSCGNSSCAPVTVTVLSVTSAPYQATVDHTDFCPYAYGTITLTSFGGAGTTLKWTSGSCSGTSVGTGSPLTITPPTVTTTYYAHWENSCGNSSCASVTVVVKPLPVAPTSASVDRNNFCANAGGNINLSVTGGSGGYVNWHTGSCTGSSVGTGNSLTIAAPTVTTTYYASWETVCGSSSCAIVTVTVNPLTDSPTVITSDKNNVCSNETVTLTSHGGSGTTLKWYKDNCNGTYLNSGNPLVVTPVSTTTYYSSWENSCGNSGCASFTINVVSVPPSPSVGSPISNCGTAELTMTAANYPGTGVTHNWYFQETGGSQLSGVVVTHIDSPHATSYTNTFSTATTYYVEASNQCGSSVRVPVTATINPDPSIVITPHGNPTGNCLGNGFYLSASGGTNFQWRVNTTSGDPVSTETDYTPTQTGNNIIYLTSTNTCSHQQTVSIPVVINPVPTQPTVSIPYIIPYNTQGALSASGANPGTEGYHWYTSGGTQVSTTTPNLTANTVYYVAKYNTTTACESTPRVSFTVTVNHLPEVDAGSSQSIEAPNDQVTLHGLATDQDGTISSYLWTKRSGPAVTMSDNTSPSTTLSNLVAGNYIFRLQSTDDLNFSASDSVTVSVIALPTGSNYNFIKETNVLADGKTEISQLTGIPVEDKNITWTYFDGLGRPMQKVSWQGSPAKKDVVQAITYDSLGREDKKYLPYAESSSYDGTYKTAALTNLSGFYQNIQGFSAEDLPYSQTIFENSSLNRVLEQGAPGEAWQPSTGHDVRLVYNTNGTGDVKQWEIQSDSICHQDGTYGAGELYVTQTKDENGNKTKEYKDKEDRVILKKSFTGSDSLQTYYVYDDFGLLRYVLPPKASKGLSATTLNPCDSTVRQLCYYYKYDFRKRMITKQLPGASPVQMVYDKRDRLVLSQDGNMRSAHKWMFTKYDVLNRPVISGTLTTTISADTLWARFKNNNYSLYESLQSTGSIGYTLNNSFPSSLTIAETEILTVNYYDNYTLLNLSGFSGLNFNSSYHIDTYSESDGTNNGYFDFVTGKPTGSKTKVLDGYENTGSAKWLCSINYYDDRSRVIQSVRTLYDGASGGIETTSNKYDFPGKVLQSKQVQTFNTTTTIVDKYFTYDHAGRLKKEKHGIGGDTITIAGHNYNELGQLTEKNLKSGLQSIDYKYNIRGWLSEINNPDNLANDGTSDAHADLFAERLLYNTTETDLNSADPVNYNGNISAMVWNNSGGNERGYALTYDSINRIKGSDFKTRITSWADGAGAYEEKSIKYDLNGNIKTLLRTSSSGSTLNNFAYSYSGNQLKNISGGVSNYAYDNNGNVIIDGLRGFGVGYNKLNLPNKISKNTDSINYIYSAVGEKLAKRLKDGSSMYYAGSMVYNNLKNLDYLLFEEGRVTKDSIGYTYEYNLKDHLGNTRAVFKNSNGTPTVLQVAEYYPFGSSFIPMNTSTDNKYLYNGKEIQDDILGSVSLDWYDYGARFYDPQIGRWTTSDPAAEKLKSFSPYNYVENNPIKMIDPDGCSGEVVIDKQNKVITVTSNLILYGSSANAALAASTARDVQNQWNAAGGSVSVGGVDYSVKFAVNGSYSSDLKASDITGNTDIKNNYFKVVESGVPISSADGVGSNTGVFLKSNISKDGSTTESHEMGHTWGAVKGTADGHPVDKDLRGQGQPGMMNARGTYVDPQYQYDPNAKPGAPGGTINPDKRQVTQQDINYLNLDKLKYDQSGKAQLGSLSNIAH